MGEHQNTVKEPISKEAIYKVMIYATFIVASVFFIKNIAAKSLLGILVIGGGLLVLAGILLGMKAMHLPDEKKQFTVSIAIVFLVFMISMNSGVSYSDDFAMYLAIIGLSGMYLRPKYALTQTVLADILLVIAYMVHPEKGGELSQYILCMAVFNLAAFMFYMAIKRGRAYIERSRRRAEEAEQLLDTLATIGLELEKNFENSSHQFDNLRKANGQLENNAMELRQGSESISQGARDVAVTCEEVQEKMQITESQIDELNSEVRRFELALDTNRGNMDAMNRQMESVRATIQEANEVFQIMQQQMQEIAEVTEQLTTISSGTTMLALNASIEAARAGQMGAGFAVVASNVQELAVDSNRCSTQVANVVNAMQEQVKKTTKQLSESALAVNESLKTLEGLQGGFNKMTTQFGSLYNNIERQNNNVTQVEDIFTQLKNRISEMSSCSEENQSAVASIAEAMGMYKENMNTVIEDTMQVHELSASMLEISNEKRQTVNLEP